LEQDTAPYEKLTRSSGGDDSFFLSSVPFVWLSIDPKKHELSRLLNPEKYAHTAAIERLQPYDPDKTVVLVIHGLKDSQATWTPMINKLRGEKRLIPLISGHGFVCSLLSMVDHGESVSQRLARNPDDALERPA
jgi:hypothetical protein